MAETRQTITNRARELVSSLLVPSGAPFKDYLRATDCCTAVMNYTDLEPDREYLAQWRAAFAALMVAESSERTPLLRQLRHDFDRGRSPLPTLIAHRR